ncbi:MAG: hypothetical protein U5J63_11015 [Fodinibius sp.]|nr:hypothetical protein [Fodinibius sp.]
MSALDRKYEGDSVIREGMPNVLKNIRDQLGNSEKSSLYESYLKAIEQLDHFPAEVSWPQVELRFTAQDDDSLYIKAGKTGKRLGRSVSQLWLNISGIFNSSNTDNKRAGWTHQVPLQSFVQYHLLDPALIQPTVDALERARMAVITDIEEWLVKRCKGESPESLTDLTRDLEEKLQQKRSAVKQQLSEIFQEKVEVLQTEAPKQVPSSTLIARIPASVCPAGRRPLLRICSSISASGFRLNSCCWIGPATSSNS